MKDWLFYGLIAAYILGTYITAFRAFAHYKDPGRARNWLDLYHPSHFTPAGQPARRLALWYAWLACAVLFLYFILF